MTKKQKRHIRDALRKVKRVAWNKGIPMREETKRKLREADKGKIGKEASNWQGGRSEYVYKVAFENLPNRCETCGTSKRLMVHHKDLMGTVYELRRLPDLANHRLGNLQILCRSCHKRLHDGLKKQSVLVLLSAGLDSTTVLYWAMSEFKNVSALTFNYHQVHSKEVELAKVITDRLKIKHWVLDLDIWEQMKERVSLIKGSKKQIRTKLTKKGVIPSTFVPGRNLIFLAIAGAFCSAFDINHIVTGINHIDASNYPDTRPEFVKATAETLQLALERSTLRIFNPLLYLTKSQIVRLGTFLKVPYHLTWSCYKGGEKACGKCESCQHRLKGFKEARLKDPIKYE